MVVRYSRSMDEEFIHRAVRVRSLHTTRGESDPSAARKGPEFVGGVGDATLRLDALPRTKPTGVRIEGTFFLCFVVPAAFFPVGVVEDAESITAAAILTTQARTPRNIDPYAKSALARPTKSSAALNASSRCNARCNRNVRLCARINPP